MANIILTICTLAYESLQSRKEVREAAWMRPGWDECVSYTGEKILSLITTVSYIYRLFECGNT